MGTNFSEFLIEIYTFSLKKMHLKMSSGKWRPLSLGLNVFILPVSVPTNLWDLNLVITVLADASALYKHSVNYKFWDAFLDFFFFFWVSLAISVSVLLYGSLSTDTILNGWGLCAVFECSAGFYIWIGYITTPGAFPRATSGSLQLWSVMQLMSRGPHP